MKIGITFQFFEYKCYENRYLGAEMLHIKHFNFKMICWCKRCDKLDNSKLGSATEDMLALAHCQDHNLKENTGWFFFTGTPLKITSIGKS